MTIGIAGPVDLKLISCDLGDNLPETNGFPLVSHLINALLKRGYNVIAYTNSGAIAAPMLLRADNLTVCIACTKPQPGRRFFQFEIEQLSVLMKSYPADVIYAFWTYEYAWAALRFGIPSIVSIHDIAWKIFVGQCDLFRFVRLLINKVVLMKATKLAANSIYTYNQLTDPYKSKAVVIENFFTPELEENIKRSHTKEHAIISAVNGFNVRKGIPVALHAFAKIRQAYPDLTYYLVGIDMEVNGPAHTYAKKHNLDQGVKFVGPLPHTQLLQKIAEAKLLLHPSFEESFGMAVLESMVVGTPVLAGEKSGFIPYLLDQGRAGILCDVHSEEEIATKTIDFFRNPSLADNLATNAYQYAHAHFSEEVVIQKHLKTYESVALQNKPRKKLNKALQ